MSAAPALRAVGSDERPPQPAKQRAKSVTQAAASGSDLELLVALRRRVATAVQDSKTPARELAALTRRLQEIVREIAILKERAEQDASEDDEVGDGAFDPSAV